MESTKLPLANGYSYRLESTDDRSYNIILYREKDGKERVFKMAGIPSEMVFRSISSFIMSLTEDHCKSHFKGI